MAGRPASGPRDTNSLRGDLVEPMAPGARLVTARPYAREIFHRAIERGELRAGVDLEVALDLIYGPVYLRLLQGHAPLDDAFAEAAIDLTLAGIEPAAAPD